MTGSGWTFSLIALCVGGYFASSFLLDGAINAPISKPGTVVIRPNAQTTLREVQPTARHGQTAQRDGQTVVDKATVRDGNTIVVAGIPIRLNGLHAPELHEPGSIAARDWMVAATAGQVITCRLNGDRTHDRSVGVCSNSRGDLAPQLIAAGLGRDCPRWSGGRYARYETATAGRMPLPAYCATR